MTKEVKVTDFYGTGRKKTASARVWIKKGTGKIIINNKDLEQYFGNNTLRVMVLQPFAQVSSPNEYDVFCTVSGSGPTGQAGAIRHGISRALDLANPLFRTKLKEAGLLTRDSRQVERKKYGRKKARKRFQFCKR
jgi:small subunit ribosomal protein S9